MQLDSAIPSDTVSSKDEDHGLHITESNMTVDLDVTFSQFQVEQRFLTVNGSIVPNCTSQGFSLPDEILSRVYSRKVTNISFPMQFSPLSESVTLSSLMLKRSSDRFPRNCDRKACLSKASVSRRFGSRPARFQ
jgi:hypothetical protein